MRKGKLKLRLCVKMFSIVILMSFLRFPVFGDPPMTQLPTLSESEMRYYSSSEIDLLIEDLTTVAVEAIEQAAAEAAKAATLAAVEREAAALYEASYWRNEAAVNYGAIVEAQRAGRKNTVLAALFGILGGLALGIGGTLIISGR
jgi:hypothetical protein